MRAVVERASAFEPSVRYQSAAELARALGAEVADAAASGGREGRDAAGGARARGVSGARAGAPARRNSVKALFAVMAAVAFVVAVALIVTTTLGQGEGDADVSAADEPAQNQTQLQPEGRHGAMRATWTTPTARAARVAPVADENPLEIVESGWSVGSTGYVNYAFALRNNGSVLIEYPAVTVTGRDADGSVLFSDDWVVSEVGGRGDRLLCLYGRQRDGSGNGGHHPHRAR